MCLQINKHISPKLVVNYFPLQFRLQKCAANPYTFRPCHEEEAKIKLSMAKHNKIAKPFPMWPRRSIFLGGAFLAQFFKYKNHNKSEQAIFSMLSTPKC